jgi:hypothetical protein
VGAGGPKRVDGDETGGISPFEALLNHRESAVSDVVLGGPTSDPMLVALLELTITSIRDERPVYPNLIDEPILFRHFRRFVRKALDAQEKINRFIEGE